MGLALSCVSCADRSLFGPNGLALRHLVELWWMVLWLTGVPAVATIVGLLRGALPATVPQGGRVRLTLLVLGVVLTPTILAAVLVSSL